MAFEDEEVFACETLLGKSLEGRKRRGNWRVVQRYERSPDSTGGNFSVGYKVVHDDGSEGFLKAADVGFLRRFDDLEPLEKLQRTTNEQIFERQILDICRGNNMDRIVHALDYGEFESTEGGVRDLVFYIIFELAECDVRQQVLRNRRHNLSWTAYALHNLVVAIRQLHRADIAHNDVKPSNLLVFDENLQKLADLGRATAAEQIGPWDGLDFTGDPRYVAPEFWYRNVDFPKYAGKVDFEVRRASDLYLVGSMGFFFVTGAPLTPLLAQQMRSEHLPPEWCGSFEDALPYIRDAIGQAMAYFDAELPRASSGEFLREASELRAAVLQLCEPDPSIRGHPLNISMGAHRYDVERYVALFDRLAKSLEVKERLLS